MNTPALCVQPHDEPQQAADGTYLCPGCYARLERALTRATVPVPPLPPLPPTALTVDRQNLVWVDCDVLYDPKTRKPRSIRDVHNVGPFPPVHPDETADVNRLASLTEGWFDGDGERLDPSVLKAAVEVLNAARAAGVARPRIGAEPEGSITLEWIGYPSGTVLYVEDAGAFSLLHTNAQTHETTHESDISTAQQAVDRLVDLRQG